MSKTEMVEAQHNVHDGTVLISQEYEDHAAITILGRHEVDSEFPTIVVFDLDDLKYLSEVYGRIRAGDPS